MNYCVFDVESTYGTFNNRVSSPFSNETGLCAAGFYFSKNDRTEYKQEYYVRNVKGINQGIKGKAATIPSLDDIELLIGHNIKFDLLWLYENREIKKFINNGGRIWDTAYAEYLLSAQFYNLHGGETRGVSLKQVAKRRKCEHQKLDIVAAMWEEGYRTEDIDKKILFEYLNYDVLATKDIFLKQYKEAFVKGMMPCLTERHEGLLATTEMEYNGLHVDTEVAKRQQRQLEIDIKEQEKELNKYLPRLPTGCEFKWGSWKNVSAFLYGGLLKYQARKIKYDDKGNPYYYQKKVRLPVLKDDKPVYFKSGKNIGKPKTTSITVNDIERGPKTRLVSAEYELPRQITPDDSWKSSSEGYYQTGESILKEIKEKYQLNIVDKILDLKGKIKDLGTYYEKTAKNGNKSGMLTCIQDDGLIHGHLNHNITVTTRLSSTKPNLQNISSEGKSEVKRVFNSRYNDGVIVEIDYSQLEVVCKAVLAGDDVMLDAVLNGIDEHCEWLAFAEDMTYDEVKKLCSNDPKWKKKRKAIKAATFGEKYGAGISTLSKSSGIHPDKIEKALEARKKKYYKTYQFDDMVLDTVKRSRKPTKERTPSGFTAGFGTWKSPTGTVYGYLESDAPEWQHNQGIYTAFPIPIIKNYNSQGLGGEIMQVQVGRLFRVLKERALTKEIKLINTVHDSVYLDMPKSCIEYLPAISGLLEDVSPYFNKRFGTDWNVPFRVSCEYGDNMLETVNEVTERSKGYINE